VREKMRFVQLPDIDVVEALFDDCVLKSPEDAQTWADTVSSIMSAYPGKVWLLINLDGLIVRPSASVAFGKLRADVLGRFAHASVRYGGDPWTLVSINTSAVVHQTHGNVHRTRDAALAELLTLRANTTQAS
jgi:hypothetical protein